MQGFKYVFVKFLFAYLFYICCVSPFFDLPL